MTLYEEYQNGLDVVDYCMRAYENLKRAVFLNNEENGIYDERDMEIEWQYFRLIGNITWITENKGVRDLIKDSFKITGDYIDSKLLAMIRAYEDMSIEEFLRIYGGVHKQVKSIDREESRTIKSIHLLASDSEVLDCASIKGPMRSDNEDFAVSIVSPYNHKVKLLIICDGAGIGFGNIIIPKKGADQVSKQVASEFINWFNAYDFSNGMGNIDVKLNEVLDSIRETVRKGKYMAATTITFAIVGEKETVMGNIGDSRAYIIKDGNLTQITEDDSEVWEKYYANDSYPYTKDDFRFLRDVNDVTNAIDGLKFLRVPHIYHVLNSDYDGVLLMSDGVSSILSDDMMSRIFQETKPQDFLDELLWESCFGEPDYPSIDDEEVLIPTLPGRDNASASLYLKLK